MQLNHLDLPVPDTSVTKSFFVDHLGFKCVFDRDDGLTVLVDEAGFALTLSPLPSDESLIYPTGSMWVSISKKNPSSCKPTIGLSQQDLR